MRNARYPISNCDFCESQDDFPVVVVSRGNPLAILMVIGEAPGAIEEKTGKPFVGRSGKLLDILLDDVGINPDQDVYFCNVVKCRPPKNRRPKREEIEASLPWLNQQIFLVNPHVIILTGATAVESVLGLDQAMTSLRGTWQNWKGRLVMPVFHPSYLLRNRTAMSLAWKDFRMIASLAFGNNDKI